MIRAGNVTRTGNKKNAYRQEFGGGGRINETTRNEWMLVRESEWILEKKDESGTSGGLL
jgi:hypothetical protein